MVARGKGDCYQASVKVWQLIALIVAMYAAIYFVIRPRHYRLLAIAVLLLVVWPLVW